MKYPLPLLIIFLLGTALLQGCAGAVVGGAAASGAAVHDRRTVGTVVDDEIIELKAADSIFSDKELYDNTHINITSYNNIVLLSGEAPNETLRTRVYNNVSKIQKVRKIHNEIAIAAPSSLLTRGSDSLITSKVKVQLFGIKDLKGFDPTRVKVVTENGVVYLLGLTTRTEADAVTQVARRVSGVQHVVRLFEYLN